MKSCANLLEKENSELNLQLKDIKAHHNEIQEENSKLQTQLKSLQKAIIDPGEMKVKANILQEENSELKSQLTVAQSQLKLLEKKQYSNRYEKFKNEEGCSIAIQTDTVCILCSKKPMLKYKNIIL